MYHCLTLTSVITSIIWLPAVGVAVACPLRSSESVEHPVHRGGEQQIDDPQKQAEERRREDHHDRRRVDFLARRPGDALQLVPHFDEERAAAIPPAGDVLSRFSDVVCYHVTARHSWCSVTVPNPLWQARRV